MLASEGVVGGALSREPCSGVPPKRRERRAMQGPSRMKDNHRYYTPQVRLSYCRRKSACVLVIFPGRGCDVAETMHLIRRILLCLDYHHTASAPTTNAYFVAPGIAVDRGPGRAMRPAEDGSISANPADCIPIAIAYDYASGLAAKSDCSALSPPAPQRGSCCDDVFTIKGGRRACAPPSPPAPAESITSKDSGHRCVAPVMHTWTGAQALNDGWVQGGG